ncbi:GNAT family N-acetyltransferase [Marinicella meishanensis]|uniref:GNAT family N-acetyltransferase n=1 Tax=Marinicella meishanensis TaxID=2873263 RepID=UPI001CBBD051|nr:GNAT family N-acetyltransferase [Marinicella sp. NBU2979]
MSKDPAPLTFVAATNADLQQVLGWFASARDLLYWGGPDLTFPPELNRFKQQSKYHKSHSHVLRLGHEVVAFGQFYNRLERCHLGRLAVSPKHRGQRLGEQLIEQLLRQGHQQLNLAEASLFVLNDNRPAMRLYRRMGFVERPYPKPIPLPNCVYMIRPEKPA